MKKGLQEKTHQASDEEVQAGIAYLEWVLSDHVEQTKNQDARRQMV
jgi:hypothetical protein